MKFLSVLCVVLYLQSGVYAHANNNENAHYFNKYATQRDVSLHNNIEPNSGINWQTQALEDKRNQPINSRQFNSREDFTSESLNSSPEYENLQRKIYLNEASINTNNMAKQQSFRQEKILPSYMNPYQDIRVSNENRVNEQEGSRRQNILQGFPSEYVRHKPIQNINAQPLRPQEYVSSLMLNDARLINTPKQINEPHLISRDISRLPLNLRDFSSEQTQLVQNINELPLKKQENILGMLPDSKYINTQPIKQSNEPLIESRDDISEYIKHQPLYRQTWEIKPEDRNSMIETDSNRFINPKSIINQPVLKQKEETRLELEGISPEYIESLINQKVHESLLSTRSLQDSYQNINKPLESTEELNNNQYNLRNQEIDKISTFRNPSAEILYKMQKALPYETELPSQGDSNLKRGQEFYTSPSPTKRYMVIHPNGRVEYVDQIAKIIENHPNYVMVKSEDYLKHLEDRSKTHSVPFIPQINKNLPISALETAAIKREYDEENHNVPDIKLDHASSIAKNSAPYLDISLITTTEKLDFTPPTTASTFKKSPLASLIVNSVPTTSPQQKIEQDNIANQDSQNITVSSSLTPVETSTENIKNNSNEDIINKKLFTKPVPVTEANKTTITESVSETDKFKKSPLASLIVNNAATVALQEKNEHVSNIVNQNITVSSTLTPIEISTENEKNKSDYYTIDKKIITKPIPDFEFNKTEITEFSIQPQNNSDAQLNTEESYNTEILPISLEILPNNLSENTSIIAEAISDETSTDKTGTMTPLPVLYETEISNISKTDCHNDTEISSPNAEKTYPESTSFFQDTQNADNSTGFWFEADEDFWEKIMTRNETQNQFYFFFVPPKPSIEKETKTTVFANGTTIEEVIETVTKDGKSKILKTTKIIHANCTSGIE